MRTTIAFAVTFLALATMTTAQAQAPMAPPTDAAATMREAGREANEAADAAREAARLALQASKAAVKDAPKQSADMIGKLVTDAADAATRAETKIAEANRAAGVSANASMRKAADSARKSVEATQAAVRKSTGCHGGLGQLQHGGGPAGGIRGACVHCPGRNGHRERRPRRSRGRPDHLGPRHGAGPGPRLTPVGRSFRTGTSRRTTMAMSKMARTCEEAAHQHDRAAAHYRHSAKHLEKGEHAAAAKERDLALDHSEKARIDEVGLRPDGLALNERTVSEAAWHFMG